MDWDKVNSLMMQLDDFFNSSNTTSTNILQTMLHIELEGTPELKAAAHKLDTIYKKRKAHRERMLSPEAGN